MIAVKAFEQQKRPLLSLFRWPARIAAVFDVAILHAVGDAGRKTTKSLTSKDPSHARYIARPQHLSRHFPCPRNSLFGDC